MPMIRPESHPTCANVPLAIGFPSDGFDQKWPEAGLAGPKRARSEICRSFRPQWILHHSLGYDPVQVLAIVEMA